LVMKHRLWEKFHVTDIRIYLKEENSLRTASKISSVVHVAFICIECNKYSQKSQRPVWKINRTSFTTIYPCFVHLSKRLASNEV
jgi:hypothetical protein